MDVLFAVVPYVNRPRTGRFEFPEHLDDRRFTSNPRLTIGRLTDNPVTKQRGKSARPRRVACIVLLLEAGTAVAINAPEKNPKKHQKR
jgi:hypothetical protein